MAINLDDDRGLDAQTNRFKISRYANHPDLRLPHSARLHHIPKVPS